MKQLQTSPGGRTARWAFFWPGRKSVPLFALALILGMAIWLPNLSTPALAQNECLLDCQQQYHACLNQPHPPMSCEEQYDSCSEACLGW
jgi:hypothetical protein